MQPNRPVTIDISIGVGLLIVLLFTVIPIRRRGARTGDTTWTSSAAVDAAKMACKKVGDEQLPARATAIWQALSQDFGVELGKDHFHVQLVVDAQNGFGAFRREVVDCQVTKEGNFFHVTAAAITSR